MAMDSLEKLTMRLIDEIKSGIGGGFTEVSITGVNYIFYDRGNSIEKNHIGKILKKPFYTDDPKNIVFEVTVTYTSTGGKVLCYNKIIEFLKKKHGLRKAEEIKWVKDHY